MFAFSVLSRPFQPFRLFFKKGFKSSFYGMALFGSFGPIHERCGRWWPLAVGLGTRQDNPVKVSETAARTCHEAPSHGDFYTESNSQLRGGDGS